MPFSDEEMAQRELDLVAFAELDWAGLRGQRDARLAACDWTQLPDAPLTRGERRRWKRYRRALRDLPAATTDPLAPAWPTPPAPGGAGRA